MGQMMSRKDALEHIVFDGERHIRGEMCWCDPTYERDTDTYRHSLKLDKGFNVYRRNAWKFTA